MAAEPAAKLDGRVSSVDGDVIRLANGLIAVDASHAKFVRRRLPTTIAAVTKDSRIEATLKGSAFPSNAVLPATSIDVVRSSYLELAGVVSAVDAARGMLTILGLTFDVIKGLPNVKPPQMLAVDVDRRGDRLVVVALAPMIIESDISEMTQAGDVCGYVSSVDGDLVRLADGLITIDQAGQKPRIPLKRGSSVIARVKPATAGPNAPLVPWSIAEYPLSDVMLLGTVTATDAERRAFMLLGQTIYIGPETVAEAHLVIESGASLLVFAKLRGRELVAVSMRRWALG